MLNNSGNDFVNFVVKEFGELAELFKQKNEQYGGRDPLANFRTGALMEKGFDTWPAMFDEAKNYQRKHVAHVQNCNISGPKNCNISGPKVDESLKDIAVYAVIMLYMRTKYLEQIAEVEKEV